jgi:hypothetical protein
MKEGRCLRFSNNHGISRPVVIGDEERGLLNVRKIDRNRLICQGFQLDLGCITPIERQLFQRSNPVLSRTPLQKLLQHVIFADSRSRIKFRNCVESNDTVCYYGRGGVLRCFTYNFSYYKCHLAVKNQHIK